MVYTTNTGIMVHTTNIGNPRRNNYRYPFNRENSVDSTDSFWGDIALENDTYDTSENLNELADQSGRGYPGDPRSFTDEIKSMYKMSIINSRLPRRRRNLLFTFICLTIGIALVLLMIKRNVNNHDNNNIKNQDSVNAPVVEFTQDSPTSVNDDSIITMYDPIEGKPYIVHSQSAVTQIQNYHAGNALIINLHIEHQAGIVVCEAIGKSPSVPSKSTPSFVCLKTTEDDNIPQSSSRTYPLNKYPWSTIDTSKNIQIIRTNFHFIEWEFRYAPTQLYHTLQDTVWEDPNLISILVIRHPIKRLFSGDGIMAREHPNVFVYNNATENDWWDFVKTEYTNNYQLRILAGPNYKDESDKYCCNGSNTSRVHLYHAKELIKRFTFVLDMECLDNGLQAITNILNITIGKHRKAHGKDVIPIHDRINDDAIYNYLLERNALDIELYDWARTTRSLIDCSNI